MTTRPLETPRRATSTDNRETIRVTTCDAACSWAIEILRFNDQQVGLGLPQPGADDGISCLQTDGVHAGGVPPPGPYLLLLKAQRLALLCHQDQLRLARREQDPAQLVLVLQVDGD